MPDLGQGSITAYNTVVSATVGTTNSTIPDNQVTNVAAAQVCSCSTATHTKKRTQVKNNSFQFGGRIDVVEAAQEAASGSSGAQSAGSAQRQTTTVTNNNGGQGSLPTNGTCVTVCLE